MPVPRPPSSAIAFFAALVIVTAAHSQEKANEIETDRPDVTPYTVPKGSLQLENGMAWTVDESGRALDLTESLLRVGVGNSTEFRIGIPDYFYRLGKTVAPPSGFGDLLVGVKQRLGEVAGFDLAVVPAITFPTGAAGWSSGGIDPQLEFPWQRELSRRWSISGTLGVFGLTENGRRKPIGECQVELEREIGRRDDAFVEFQGFDGVGPADHSLQIGGGHKLNPNQRLDYFVVVGLSRAATNFAAGIGFSFRLDRLRR
jgi:hypothetical protein